MNLAGAQRNFGVGNVWAKIVFCRRLLVVLKAHYCDLLYISPQSYKDYDTHPNEPIEDPGLLDPQEGVNTPGEGVLLLQGGHRGTGHLQQKHVLLSTI